MDLALNAEVIDGRYQVVRVLGEGTFARTLACEDLQEANRPVAVKELRVQGLGDWKPVELFEREARVLQTLRHAGIPQIHRHFEARDGEGRVRLYLVMELIDGPSLQDELRAGRTFSEIEVLELTLALLEVLEYLHGRRPPIFHRDIKPSNIVLRSSGTPVLVDFGGVCDGWRPALGGSTVTGTYGYMPPEQLVGQVSPASDLYALGATLLHLLSGREPAEFSMDAGRLVLPPEVSVRPALRRTVDAFLAPAPRDRPHSAREARRLLLDASTTAIAAKPPSSMVRAAVPRGGRPELVDMGPPPRDPDGALHDVYLNLIHPIYRPRTVRNARPRGWRRVGRVVGLGTLSVLGGIGSLGIYHAWKFRFHRRRRRFMEPLFRNGLATTGRLVNLGVTTNLRLARITYEYEVGGHRYRSEMVGYPHILPVLVRRRSGDRPP